MLWTFAEKYRGDRRSCLGSALRRGWAAQQIHPAPALPRSLSRPCWAAHLHGAFHLQSALWHGDSQLQILSHLVAAGSCWAFKMQGLLSSLQPAWTMARPENQMQHSSAIQLEQLCCLRACLLRCLETWHAVTGAVGDAQSADGEHVCRALAIQQLSGAAPCPDSRRAHEEPQRLPGTYPL